MSKEKFEIRLRIKDNKDGKITNFKEKIDLEVNWGKVKVPQEVILKKDGKEYKIIITKLEVAGLLKKRVAECSWTPPPNSSYYFYHDPSSNSELTWDEEPEEGIKFVNPWRTEFIIFSSIAVIIAIVAIIFLWRSWRKRRNWRV